MTDRPIIYCDVVGHRRFLEVCVCFCDRRKKDGPLSEVYSECSVAISKHRCPVVQQLYPKQRGKHASNVQQARDAADSGLTPREQHVGEGSAGEDKPRGLSSGKGRKAAPVPKEKRGRSGDVLPPLRSKGVPKNKRQNKKVVRASK